MPYIDCYLTPVPRVNKAAYEALARVSAEVVKQHGAIRVVEAWLDEQGPQADSYHGESARQEPQAYNHFALAAGARGGEAVVMSWVEWPDRVTRDAGMAKVTSDPRMQFDGQPPVFDGARLIAGGFVPMLDSGHAAPEAGTSATRRRQVGSAPGT